MITTARRSYSSISRDLKAQITRPVKELKGFRKIFLKKGESADVTFDITRAELEYVLADGSVVSDPGEFELFIGAGSARAPTRPIQCALDNRPR